MTILDRARLRGETIAKRYEWVHRGIQQLNFPEYDRVEEADVRGIIGQGGRVLVDDVVGSVVLLLAVPVQLRSDEFPLSGDSDGPFALP
jgi:hypothetical protein